MIWCLHQFFQRQGTSVIVRQMRLGQIVLIKHLGKFQETFLMYSEYQIDMLACMTVWIQKIVFGT